MTPAIKVLEQLGIAFSLHEYEPDPNHKSYGLEAAEKLGVPAALVFKTLVVQLNTGDLSVGIVPVSCDLNLKKMAATLKAKRAEMADPKKVERSTGYVLGGVSPLGQKKRLNTIIDTSAADHLTVYISGGKRGLEIELSPDALKTATAATFAHIAT